MTEAKPHFVQNGQWIIAETKFINDQLSDLLQEVRYDWGPVDFNLFDVSSYKPNTPDEASEVTRLIMKNGHEFTVRIPFLTFRKLILSQV